MSGSASDLRRLALVGNIIRLLDAGEPQITAGMLLEDPADEDGRKTVSADARTLRDQGLLDLDERYMGAWTARPTRAGRDAWQDHVARRDDTVQRQKRLRNDYLRWLYEQTRKGQYTVADHFLESGRTFLGSPYSLAELSQAGAWLVDRGFIEGPGAHGRSDPLRARPTVKGEDWIEAGRDVHDPVPQASGASYTVHGDAQIAHGSQHILQVQGNSRGEKGAVQLADMLDQLALTLGPEAAEQVTGFAIDLREEAQGQARTSRFREIGDAVTKAFSSGIAGALGSGIVANVGAWLATLS